jgi:cyclophilin family peptidyl-prolyl cis-trans isomerase
LANLSLMDFFRRFTFAFTLLVAPLTVRAQSTVPTLTQALPAQTIGVGGAAVNLDLRNYFSLPGVTSQVAQFDTVLGKFNVELLANDAPLSVNNFLAYVADGSYANTIFHRSAALDGGTGNRIVQGGGYDTTGASINRKSPIALEYKLANVRGTLALARTSDPNSATSEWFFNVDDNTTVLGAGNGGGYAVFARVLGSGMSVVDAIAAVPTYNAANPPTDLTSPFRTLPLRDVTPGQQTITPANFIIVNSITVVPVYPTSASLTAVLAFAVANNNSAAVTATLSGSTLTLTPVGTGTATISVRAADTNGNAISSAFNVTVTNPTITSQPSPQTVSSGSTVVFSVTATGVPAPTYQWLRGSTQPGVGTPALIQGATSPTLVLSGVSGANAALAGNYSVVVANSVSAVTSNPATLTVITTNDPGRLINLSILTPLAAGETMTMGTVLGGSGTGGTKALLARAAGPSLTAFGLTAVLPSPTMTLANSASVAVASNTGWGVNAPTLSAVFTQVGAFPYLSTTSKDSAIYQANLAPGNYTVQVGDAGGGTGSVIAELYDATPGSAFTATTPRLINVSVLKQISAGSSLTAGFVIGGSTARTVLIRAVGPRLGLAPFSIPGAMPAPTMTLNNTSVSPAVVVATNSGWGGNSALLQAGNSVGAFAVTDPTSKDAMLLVTLAPGNYTAQVGPAGSSAGGTAIVEVYEVP